MTISSHTLLSKPPLPWTPEAYLDTLSSLSTSKKSWKVADTGKIEEINRLSFLFEKFKGFAGFCDHTKKELISHHLLKFLAYGHQHQLLNQQDEKIQNITLRMKWSFPQLHKSLEELFEKTKPLQFKINTIHSRLGLLIEKEKAGEKGSWEYMCKRSQEKFELGLMSQKRFDKIQAFFQEERKGIDDIITQAETVLKRKEETEEYLTELFDGFEKCLSRYEDLLLKLDELIDKSKLRVPKKILFQKQILLERGLLGYIKGSHPINAYVESRIAKNSLQRETLLHLACALGNLPLIKWLLDRQANPNVFNKTGMDPLIIAIDSKFCKEIPYLLIEKGANVHYAPFGTSPVFRAIYEQNLDLLKLLVKKGTAINHINDFEKTPLSAAICRRNPEIIKFLLENSAKTDHPVEFTGRTCMHLAYMTNQPIEHMSESEELECREINHRISLANIWTLYGQTLFRNKRIRIEGGVSGIEQIQQLFSDFLQIYGKTPSFDLVNALFNEHTIPQRMDPQECMRRFKAGETLILNSGYSGHRISIIYHQDYLLLLNRGENAEQFPIFVQKIDRTKAHLTEKHWKKLLQATSPSFAAKKFFYKTLPALSGKIKDTNDPIANFLHNFFQNDQSVGNCWIVSPKLIPLALLLLTELIPLNEPIQGPPLIKSYLHHRRQQQVFNQAYDGMYKPFTTFIRLQTLKNYLLHVLEAKEKYQQALLEPDHVLIRVAMHRYHAKYSRKFSRFQDLENEIKQLYDRYLVAFDQKSISLIGPAFLRIAWRLTPKLHLKKRVIKHIKLARSFYKKLKDMTESIRQMPK
jgi:hypothetical protein